MGKNYYYDAKKERYIARAVKDGKRTNIGCFKTEQEAIEAVKAHFNPPVVPDPKCDYHCKVCNINIPYHTSNEHTRSFNHQQNLNKILNVDKKEEMPPRRRVNPPLPVRVVTLEMCIRAIEALPNPASTKRIWKNNLISLANYSLPEDQRHDDMTYEEMGVALKEINMGALITDFERTRTIIEGVILNKQTGQPIIAETKKQYWFSILSIVGTNGAIQVSDEVLKQYKDKKTEYEKESHRSRKALAPTGVRLKYPDWFYEDAQREYEEYITPPQFTNTKTGRKNLKSAVIAGLYLLQRPRRIEDYHNLQWFSKLPDENKRKDKNIIVIEGDTATFYIDKFKTRWSTKNGRKKEVLPTYVKVVNPKLVELIKKHISHHKIPDMTKVRNDEQHYLFFMDTGNTTDGYNTNLFSKTAKQAFKAVFKKDLMVNDFRHLFARFVHQNPEQFNRLQLDEIAIDCGDKHWTTQYNYRDANVENRGRAITDIQDDILRRHREADEGGSVGNVPVEEQMEVIAEVDGEVEQPVRPEPVRPVVNNDVEALYRRLAELEVERARIMVQLIKS